MDESNGTTYLPTIAEILGSAPEVRYIGPVTTFFSSADKVLYLDLFRRALTQMPVTDIDAGLRQWIRTRESLFEITLSSLKRVLLMKLDPNLNVLAIDEEQQRLESLLVASRLQATAAIAATAQADAEAWIASQATVYKEFLEHMLPPVDHVIENRNKRQCRPLSNGKAPFYSATDCSNVFFPQSLGSSAIKSRRALKERKKYHRYGSFKGTDYVPFVEKDRIAEIHEEISEKWSKWVADAFDEDAELDEARQRQVQFEAEKVVRQARLVTQQLEANRQAEIAAAEVRQRQFEGESRRAQEAAHQAQMDAYARAAAEQHEIQIRQSQAQAEAWQAQLQAEQFEANRLAEIEILKQRSMEFNRQFQLKAAQQAEFDAQQEREANKLAEEWEVSNASVTFEASTQQEFEASELPDYETVMVAEKSGQTDISSPSELGITDTPVTSVRNGVIGFSLHSPTTVTAAGASPAAPAQFASLTLVANDSMSGMVETPAISMEELCEAMDCKLCLPTELSSEVVAPAPVPQQSTAAVFGLAESSRMTIFSDQADPSEPAQAPKYTSIAKEADVSGLTELLGRTELVDPVEDANSAAAILMGMQTNVSVAVEPKQSWDYVYGLYQNIVTNHGLRKIEICSQRRSAAHKKVVNAKKSASVRKAPRKDNKAGKKNADGGDRRLRTPPRAARARAPSPPSVYELRLEVEAKAQQKRRNANGIAQAIALAAAKKAADEAEAMREAMREAERQAEATRVQVEADRQAMAIQVDGITSGFQSANLRSEVDNEEL